MNKSSDWIDEFGEILKLCGKFGFEVTERLFACLRLQDEGYFKMKELLESLPAEDRALLTMLFSEFDQLVGCTLEEAENLI